jgi:uncharacterized membrane protein
MTRRSAWWAVDLVVLVLYVAAVNVAVGVGLPGSLWRAALVLPLTLFVPGYALVALTFPERYGSRSASVESDRNPLRQWAADQQGLPPLGRFTLSVGVSTVLVPLTVLVMNFVTGVYLTPILLVLSAEVVAFAALALLARQRLPAEERFTPHPDALFGRTRTAPGGAGRRSNLGTSDSSSSVLARPLGLLLVVSIAALVGSVAFAAALPMAGIPAPQSTDFSEFYLTTQTDDGDYVMTDLPHDFSAGQTRPVHVTISNQEGETMEYTVVAQLQNVQNGEVTGRRTVGTFSRQVEENETVHIKHDLQPRATGSNLRVTYLLYKGDPPENPTRDNAYRSTRLWITVSG